MAVHTVGGDLPPIGDVLADLVPVAVPLAPLAVGLGCGEAHLVLLQKAQQRATRVRLLFSITDIQPLEGRTRENKRLWIYSLYVR